MATAVGIAALRVWRSCTNARNRREPRDEWKLRNWKEFLEKELLLPQYLVPLTIWILIGVRKILREPASNRISYWMNEIPLAKGDYDGVSGVRDVRRSGVKLR